MQRSDGRNHYELRPIEIVPEYLKYAEGSVLIEMGNTRVLCAASVENSVPNWRKGEGLGWVTAEYSLLPRSTQRRNIREAARGKIGGRTHEIQRLIGRALRSVVDLEALGERTVWIDCDVIQADGGTRTAAVTGAFVALAHAVNYLQKMGEIKRFPLTDFIAGVSTGVVNGEIMLDLNFEEDSAADVDMNIMITGSGEFVELQGTGEKRSFNKKELDKLLELGYEGAQTLFYRQSEALGKDISSKLKSNQEQVTRLLLATHNQGKVKELREMLSPLPVEVISLQKYPDLPPVEETGTTFHENAILKAENICQQTGEIVLADDSGLEVDYLGGEPGVYSARFSGENAADEENNSLLLKKLEGVPYEKRHARFVCVIAIARPGEEVITVEGECRGIITTSPRGERGFGYDPLFYHEGEGKTFGEMDVHTKSRVSHRGNALQKSREVLKQLFKGKI